MGYVFNPFTGNLDQVGGSPRRGASEVVIAIAGSATEVGVISLPRSCQIISMELSHPGWVRLYSSDAAVAADAGRARSAAPQAGAGVIADPVFAPAGVINFDPVPSAINRQAPVSGAYPVRITNDGSTGDVTLTIEYLSLEA